MKAVSAKEDDANTARPLVESTAIIILKFTR
jgi:hypothetical protein